VRLGCWGFYGWRIKLGSAGERSEAGEREG
jgi:hypothetical protein